MRVAKQACVGFRIPVALRLIALAIIKRAFFRIERLGEALRRHRPRPGRYLPVQAATGSFDLIIKPSRDSMHVTLGLPPVGSKSPAKLGLPAHRKPQLFPG